MGGPAPGTPDGSFSLLYRFEDEQLSETSVFARPVHRLTRLYMGAIAPFRRLLVYPAVIRNVQQAWAERYGGASGVGS